MGQKIKGKTTAAFKFLVFAVLILLFSETAFAQVPGLTLDLGTDIRFETAYSYSTVVGYYLYVQKKPGMESVMLTEPTGNYALRTLVRYDTNDAMRNLSGKRLPPSDPYSRFSIISSNPIQDRQFGRAFKLFIPATVVYGNQSSARGPVPVNVLNGIHFNIRTFDQKYGDPNRSRFQNNLVTIDALAQNTSEVFRPAEFVSAHPSYDTEDSIRRELSGRTSYDEILSNMNNDDLLRLFFSLIGEIGSRVGM
jgi:hypothetical protein